jgi:hypothetical protein
MCILQLKLYSLCYCMSIYTDMLYSICELNLRYFSKIIYRFIKTFTGHIHVYTCERKKINFSTAYRRE